MSRITTLIFDLDGTLLDTLQDLTNSVNYALHTHHYPLRTAIEIRRFLGNGIRSLVQLSCPANLPTADFELVFQTFKTHYMKHCLDETTPYEGILAMLAAAKKAGYKMAVVSNKVHHAVVELNERFFSDFITVAIGESEAVQRKPSPAGVEAALKALNSTKEEAVYIGDSEVDFATAVNAQLPCISVLWGFRDQEFLEGIGATRYISAPDEMLSAVAVL